MEYIFNPLLNKSPKGPCKAGSEVTYTLKVAHKCNAGNVYFVLIDDSDNSSKQIKMPFHTRDDEYSTYQVTITYKDAGLFWYHFKITQGKHVWHLSKGHLFDVEPTKDVTASFAQAIFQKPYKVEKSFRNGIIYHVFVDRFKKSGAIPAKPGITLRRDWGGEIDKNTKDFLVINREHFGGNLQGIVDKLEYIQSLGASTILLSPIFEASSYHKYDTADLSRVDTMFGGNEALKTLVKEAKKFGINVLLDGVFNHCGSDSIYFRDAVRDPKSQYRDWFMWDHYPDRYSCWWGFDTLPQFNEENPGLQKYIAGPGGIIEKHMKTGILGFRLDVADELTNPFLDKIAARIRTAKPDAVVLGEVWEDAAIKISYGNRRKYFNGAQLNSVMNYPLKGAIISYVLTGHAEGLASVFHMLADHYPREVRHNLMNFLGTHDTKRILTALRENTDHEQKRAFQLLKIASAIQYCAPGVPAVFYGDEAGCTGGEAPFSRVCFPWGKEDKDILKWYRKLGTLRQSPVFNESEAEVLFAHNGVFILSRTKGKDRVILAINCGHEDFKLNIEHEKDMIDFESGKPVSDSIMLVPKDFVILCSANAYPQPAPNAIAREAKQPHDKKSIHAPKAATPTLAKITDDISQKYNEIENMLSELKSCVKSTKKLK